MSKMEVQLINEELLKELHDKATVNERLRQIFDLRNRGTGTCRTGGRVPVSRMIGVSNNQ